VPYASWGLKMGVTGNLSFPSCRPKLGIIKTARKTRKRGVREVSRGKGRKAKVWTPQSGTEESTTDEKIW